MRTRIPFIFSCADHTAKLEIEVVSQEEPLFSPGEELMNILPIDDYRIVEEESTKDFNEVFETLFHPDKGHLIVMPKQKDRLFFMGRTKDVKE
jgi:hypothetical protein